MLFSTHLASIFFTFGLCDSRCASLDMWPPQRRIVKPYANAFAGLRAIDTSRLRWRDYLPCDNAKEAFVLVELVNQELRNAEKRAQTLGGRVPMRRLNRTESANSVRDLLFLDDNLARKIERELPVDGKVDGFDRGGAALLVDKSQLQI